MLDFDLSLTKKLLMHLSLLAKASIQLFDEDLEPTYACTEPGNRLCQIVKCHYADRCAASDERALRQARETEADAFHYPCHFGMREMLIKLKRGNTTHGYLMVGPFRDPAAQEETLRSICNYAASYGADASEMERLYFATPTFTEEKFEAIKELAFAIFEYAINKNLIWIKHNLFETLIAPYLKSHLDAPLDAASLCAAFHLSEKQIYSIVVKATGQSPKRYVTALRMQEAKHLIQTTDEPLTAIAERVGIHDYNYFGKLFKAAFGHAPASYRRGES